MREGEVYRTTIDGYAADGAGVGRIDGMAVFVRGALRGEVCDVLLEKAGKRAAWGRVSTLVTPSPARITPDCPYTGACGGCQLRHMSYTEELDFKRTRVADALRRLGGLDTPVSVIHGANNTNCYRNKVQFPVAPPSDVGRGILDAPPPAAPRIGFYRAGSHRVVDVDDCLLQPESAARIRRAVRDWMAAHNVPAYDERARTGLIRHVFLRTNTAGESLCCLIANGEGVPAQGALIAALRACEPGLVGVVWNVNTRDTNVILGDTYRTLWGRDYLDDVLCGLVFRLSVPAFFQVNRAQTEVLYGLVSEFAALTGRETVLDLYCGVGTIGLTLAARAGRVIGAEVVREAVDDARCNAARNGIENAEFICADAAEVARRTDLRPDVVVVDPPRKGLAPDVVDAVAAMNPARVVYVSCDPATLARDAKRFTELGYRAVCAEAVDMFPRTAHVETVLLLER